MKPILILLLLLVVASAATAQSKPDSSSLSALRLKRPVIIRVDIPTQDRDSLSAVYRSATPRDSTRITKGGDTLVLRARVARLAPADGSGGFVSKGDEIISITRRQWNQLLQAVKQLQVKKP